MVVLAAKCAVGAGVEMFGDYAWHDLMGNLGVLLIVGSYFQLQINRISSNSAIYSLLNACGAALVLVSLRYDFNLSAAMVEGFWLLISLLGLFLRARNRKSASHSSSSSTGTGTH